MREGRKSGKEEGEERGRRGRRGGDEGNKREGKAHPGTPLIGLTQKLILGHQHPSVTYLSSVSSNSISYSSAPIWHQCVLVLAISTSPSSD